MKRTFYYALLGVILWGSNSSICHAEPDVSKDKLGKKIEAVELTNLSNEIQRLDVAKNQKAVAVFFLCFDCPISTSYTHTLIQLHKTYSERGVTFIGISPQDDAASLKKHLEEYKFPFPIYLDPKKKSVDAFKVTVTPEAFLLDHNLVMRYRGRIDNTYSARLKKNANTTEHDLRNALEDVLTGHAVQVPITKAIGCPVTREVKKIGNTEVTYYKDVLPILQNACQNCHRPGEVGPFSLMTYKQAVNWAEDIKEYTHARKMPPWKPINERDFHNDRRLSDAQIKTLADWTDGGTPEGDVKDAPAEKKFPEGWQLGKPDLILTVPEDFHLGASGSDTFRCFVLPTNLPEDRHIIGFEVRPGNPKIVHHTLNYWDVTGTARKMEKEQKERDEGRDDHGPGYNGKMGIGFIPDFSKSPRPGVSPIGGFGGWAPGQVPRFLPEGTGYFLPKGADVVVQVHYHRNGKPEKDRTQVGLYLNKKPIEKTYQTGVLGARGLLFIPANNDHHEVKGTAYLDNDATMYSVMPHMHLIGRSVKVTMTPVGGKPETLVEISDWDYNWQETYWLKKPLHLKAGTRFDIEAVFDNSSRNPNNPRNPPALVLFGEQTTNEMLFGFMGLTPEKQGTIARLRPTLPKELKPTPSNKP